ncbi:DUF6265 family protein [Aliiglaciecola sp. 3_MG-2023]|uniref:DUF6265 family protein n=1 Tax=Aliiglaciecola sp. 3_MG-2023 TaxID=3062644 RepID=UPI0026E3DA97|nr:DUF6265 family protein [Aliiglaciecola sp. 3_MG-2023]MDO6693968.1 DUF6265 family protein [Aliiglaciecola sp. 3_MG-2023]
MQRLIYLLSLVIITLSWSATAADSKCDGLLKLQWILGDWETLPDGNTQENWLKISDDTFTGSGSSRDVSGVLEQQESMRLVHMQREVFYLAKVGHNSLPVAFKAKNCDSNTVTFVNPNHDFPKQIVYLRTDNKLVVNVTGSNGKGFTVHYQLKSNKNAP